MKRSVFVGAAMGIFALGIFAFGGRVCYAYNGIGFSGANCQAGTTYSSNTIWHGMANSSTMAGDGQLVCPVSYPSNTSQLFQYDSIQIEIYDNVSSGDLSCFGYNQNPGAFAYYGAPRHTCNTWGGCSTNSSPSSTGWSTLFFDNSYSNLGQSSGGHNYVYDYSATAIFCSFPIDQYNGVWNYRMYLN